MPHEDPTRAQVLLIVAGPDSDEVLHHVRVIGAYQDEDGRPWFYAFGAEWPAQVLKGMAAWVTGDSELRLTVADRDGTEYVVVPKRLRSPSSVAFGPAESLGCGQMLSDLGLWLNFRDLRTLSHGRVGLLKVARK